MNILYPVNAKQSIQSAGSSGGAQLYMRLADSDNEKTLLTTLTVVPKLRLLEVSLPFSVNKLAN